MSGELFRGTSGQVYLRGAPLGERGATGQTWKAVRRNGGPLLVLKLFHEPFCTPAMRQRLEWLVERRLDRVSPVLHAPLDMIDGPGCLGHVAPFAAGTALDAYLVAPAAGFLNHLVAAAALAAGVAALERLGIAHGDLHAKNLYLELRNGVLRAALIDFDNCVAPGLPVPPSFGQISYYAPEIRRDPRPTRVSPETDRFALAVILHELLLARHPAEAVIRDDPDSFDRVMRMGGWPDDPAGSPHPRAEGGLPVHCLDPRLQNLFRRALGPMPAARPRAAEWLAALRRAVMNVYVCDHCRGSFVVDGGKRCCPLCRERFLEYRLCLPSRPPVVLRDEPVRLSRQLRDIPSGPCHAVLRRHGPDAILEPTGRIPVWRLGIPGPEPLEPRKPHLLRPGDRLRFGDVEAEVSLGARAAA
jgi:serine/threonine protein kinase